MVNAAFRVQISPNGRVAAFRGNVRLAEFKGKSYLARLSPWLAQLPQDKMEHTARVVASFHDLSAGKFDALHALLRQDLKEKVTAEQYASMLKPIKSVYDSLSPRDRKVLYASVILHDIGCINNSGWDHGITGAGMTREIIWKSGITLNMQDVSDVIRYHGLFSNFGVDVLPGDISDVPASLRRMIFILDCLDITDKATGNFTGHLRISEMTDIYNRGGLINGPELLEYRLKHLVSPSVWVELKDDPLKRLKMEIDKLSPEDQGAVFRMLIEQFRNRAFPVFHGLVYNHEGIMETVSLMRIIATLIGRSGLDKGARVIFGCDPDIFTLNKEQRNAAILNLKNRIASGKVNLQNDFTVEKDGQTLKVVLKLNYLSGII